MAELPLLPDNQQHRLSVSSPAGNSYLAAPKAPSFGQIREIPVHEDVWKRSAAQELTNPPRFPTLNK